MNVIQREDGFRIEDKFLSDVTVHVQYKYGLCSVLGVENGYGFLTSIVEYNSLIANIVSAMLIKYDPLRPNGKRVPHEAMRKYLQKKLRPLMFSAWKKQKQLCDETVVKLHQRAYREVGKVPTILSHNLITSNEYFVKDFLTYRSFAAFASLMLSYGGSTICRDLLIVKGVDAYELYSYDKTKALGDNKHFWLLHDASTMFEDIGPTYPDFIVKNAIEANLKSQENTFGGWLMSQKLYDKKSISVKPVMDESLAWLLTNFFPKWRDILSITGKSYKSLNATLDNYPGNCGRDILSLARAKLVKPITRRRELLFHNVVHSGFETGLILPVFSELSKHVTDKEIVKAMKIYNDYMEREHMRVYGNANNRDSQLALRKNKSIYFMYGYLEDACRLGREVTERPNSAYNHKGRLPELMRKAIEDHKVYSSLRLKSYNSEIELAKPDFDVYVESPGKKKAVVTPLSTVGELVKESELMHHCVRSYAGRCIKGNSFIYHIEYGGHRATAEFNAGGQLAQIRGERNTSNKATSFGEKYLRARIHNVRNNVTKYSDPAANYGPRIAAATEHYQNNAVWQQGVIQLDF